MHSCAIHVHKHSVEAMLLQQCREVTTVIRSITPWLPTYMRQSLIRCNKVQGMRPVVKISKWLEEEIASKAKGDSIWQEMYDKAAEDVALKGRITAVSRTKTGCSSAKAESGPLVIPRSVN